MDDDGLTASARFQPFKFIVCSVYTLATPKLGLRILRSQPASADSIPRCPLSIITDKRGELDADGREKLRTRGCERGPVIFVVGSPYPSESNPACGFQLQEPQYFEWFTMDSHGKWLNGKYELLESMIFRPIQTNSIF